MVHLQLENKEIAKRLAKICFKIKDEKSDLYAVQLFIETLILPKDCLSYSEKHIEEEILKYMEGTDLF